MWASKVSIGVAAFILIIITLSLGIDILLRFTMSRPIFGIQDFVRTSLTCAIALSLADTWLRDTNVRMELVYARLAASGKAAINYAAGVLGLLISLSLAWGATKAFETSLEIGSRTPLLGIPFWIVSGVVFFSSVLLAIAILRKNFFTREE